MSINSPMEEERLLHRHHGNLAGWRTAGSCREVESHRLPWALLSVNLIFKLAVNGCKVHSGLSKAESRLLFHFPLQLLWKLRPEPLGDGISCHRKNYFLHFKHSKFHHVDVFADCVSVESKLCSILSMSLYIHLCQCKWIGTRRKLERVRLYFSDMLPHLKMKLLFPDFLVFDEHTIMHRNLIITASNSRPTTFLLEMLFTYRSKAHIYDLWIWVEVQLQSNLQHCGVLWHCRSGDVCVCVCGWSGQERLY